MSDKDQEDHQSTTLRVIVAIYYTVAWISLIIVLSSILLSYTSYPIPFQVLMIAAIVLLLLLIINTVTYILYVYVQMKRELDTKDNNLICEVMIVEEYVEDDTID